MAYNGPPPTLRQQAAARLAASEIHDARYFQERRAREAANLAKTLELRALRLQKEARDRRDAPPAKRRGGRSPT